jgi:hypothetical protein
LSLTGNPNCRETDAGPDVPLITLTRGRQRIAVFDPRENALALGARYILGGYIAGWQVGDRLLTGRAMHAWDPYDGCGLPDCCEWGLGFAETPIGEPYLRIGAGRRIRCPGDRMGEAGGSLAAATAWTITSQDDTHLTWATSDILDREDGTVGYRLERTVVLHEDGPEVRTMLDLDCRWAEPINWFPHPFIAHRDGTGTVIRLPGGAVPTATGKHIVSGNLADGRWRGEPDGGFCVATGLWGRPSELSFDCDPRLGGGTMMMTVDKPIDRVVLWASPRVASAEPYWTRAWQRGERASWSARYRFTP